VSLTDDIEADRFDLKSFLDPEAAGEVIRVMQICNACRYCEGFCAVFPAMTRRRQFDEGDVGYLANLCHNCGACYHACQYAPPHEFGVNVPQALAAARNDSYAAYAWPATLAGLFRRNGPVCHAWCVCWFGANGWADAGDDCATAFLGCSFG
jgi:citrate/tricarballylate utilization protein